MTKQIRIENADTSDHKVRIHVEDRNAAGEWERVKTLDADFPTAMATEYITADRRLVVEEVVE